MRPLLLVLAALALVLAPTGRALAQGGDLLTAPAAGEEPPPTGDDDEWGWDDPPAPAASPEPLALRQPMAPAHEHRALRRVGQVGLGIVALVSASGLGLLAGWYGYSAALGYAVGFVSMTLMTGIFVAAGGRVAEPKGSYAASLLGAFIGLAIPSVLMATALATGSFGLFIFGNVLAPFLPIVGAIKGYEASMGPRSVAPAFAVVRGGATAGLSARF